jgi:hypothetical protein
MATTSNKNLSEPNYGDTNWNVPLNNNFTYLDQGFGSTFPVYVGTGGTTALTTGTAAISSVLWYNAQQLTVVSGSAGSPVNLASDATITIPTTLGTGTLGGAWIVRNTLTTTQQGIYYVYVKVAGSATSVLIPNGTSVYVYSDGTTLRIADDGTLQTESNASFGTLKSDGTTNLNISSGKTTIGWQLPFTVTITNATPAVVSFSTAVSPDATLPANNTPVYFTTTGSLPTGITANATYYVRNASSTSFNISPYYGGALAANQVTISVASPAVITNADDNAPQAGTSVVFTTTGALPTGLTAGATYYVANPVGKTYNVSASSGLTPLVNTTATGSGVNTATFGTTLINTSSAGSGTHTIYMGTTAALNVEGDISFTGELQAAGDVGNSGQYLQTQGAGLPPIWSTVGQQVIDYQPFTSSGTWVKPAGATGDDIVTGFIWAGGGGASKGGGGGGACIQFWFKASQCSATETVTIGAGGTASNSAAGGAGGNSSFNGVTVYGGGPGGGGNGTNSGGGGGGGGGAFSAGVSGANSAATNFNLIPGGGPNSGAYFDAAGGSAVLGDNIYGGGSGAGSNQYSKRSVWGGGGAGGASSTAGEAAGSSSIWGGGGGGASLTNGVSNGGNSIFGGNGGDESTAGTAPGGGGGGGSAAGAGARGEARIWTIRAVAG